MQIVRTRAEWSRGEVSTAVIVHAIIHEDLLPLLDIACRNAHQSVLKSRVPAPEKRRPTRGCQWGGPQAARRQFAHPENQGINSRSPALPLGGPARRASRALKGLNRVRLSTKFTPALITYGHCQKKNFLFPCHTDTLSNVDFHWNYQESNLNVIT